MRKLFFMLLMAAATTLCATAVTVNNTAGNLSQLVSDTQITQLTVTGTMDARDFLFITEELSELTVVDLSQATILPYNTGRALYGTVTAYNANEVPRTAFFGKKLTRVTLPTGIQSIGYAAFAGCDRLQSVTLPSTITYVGDYAFSGSGLTSIELPQTIIDMGKGVFSRCEALTSATINSRTVGDFAFLGATALNNVSLGANVEYILEGAFNGCKSLKSIAIDPSCHLWRIDDEAFINSGLENIDIKALGVGTIGEWAFAQTRLSSINLSDGMTELGAGALAHNPLLTSVAMPGLAHSSDNGRAGNGEPGGRRRAAAAPAHSLVRINDYTFAGDSLLDAGNLIPDEITHIGNYAFYNVSAEIDTMHLPQSVAYLGDMAMAGMIGMKALKTDATTVPELGNDVWAGVNQPSVPLITPDSESDELYESADQWMYFYQGTSFLLGDVNNDGQVNIADVTSLIDYLLGGSADSVNLQAADVNPDGQVNIADVTALIDRLLGGSASKSLHRIRTTLASQCLETSDHLSLGSLSMRAGETRTIDVQLLNDEYDYTAMQCEVVLPQGVKLKGVEGLDRGNGHRFLNIQHEVEENVYTIMGVSMALKTFAGHEGNVMRLTVTADDTFDGQDAEIILTNVVLVTKQHNTYLASDASTRINNPSGIDQIVGNREIVNVRYINVAGQESETPFDGINIVVTTYTDGSTTTAKVIK